MSETAQTEDPHASSAETVPKTKRERFTSLAQKRLDTVTNAMKVLGNCANRASYEFSDGEADQILEIVGDSYKKLVEQFRNEPTAEKRRLVLDPSEVS